MFLKNVRKLKHELLQKLTIPDIGIQHVTLLGLELQHITFYKTQF